jgi:hypothetical protein
MLKIGRKLFADFDNKRKKLLPKTHIEIDAMSYGMDG